MSKRYSRYSAAKSASDKEFLDKPLPARLNTEQAAVVLGFQPGDMAIFAAVKHLKPLGKPKPNAPKYYATVDIIALSNDAAWLDEATQIIYDHWKQKNSRKSVVSIETLAGEPHAALAA